MSKLICAFILVLTLTACSDSSETENNSDPVQEQDLSIDDLNFDENVESTDLMGDLSICIDVHNQVYPSDLPYEVTTNFDNYEPYFPLTDEEKKAFSLESAGVDSVFNVNLDCWLELSPDYLAYVFNVEKGEHELSTILATYQLDYTFIDSYEIAYDDIAESFVLKTAVVSKDKITVTKKTYFDEEEITIISVLLNEDGTFAEIQ